jgi:plasmid stability protein
MAGCSHPAPVAINDGSCIIDCSAMASITIRNLDDNLKARLRLRAARHGRSMEEEARDVLRTVLATEDAPPTNMVDAIRKRFAKVGPVNLVVAPREPVREPPDLGE